MEEQDIINYSESEATYENIKKYFNSINEGKIIFNIDEYIKIIKIYSKKYFNIKEKEENYHIAKNIATEIYNNVIFISNLYIRKLDYLQSSRLIRSLETDIHIATNNKMIKYIARTEYMYRLAFLLSKVDEYYEAINRCESVTSEYLTRKNELKELINYEEDNQQKDISNYSYYLNYLILFSKLAQSICEKSGTRNQIGKFYFREKLFMEKLLFRSDMPPYVYQMTSLRNNIVSNDSVITIVLSEKFQKKGFKLLLVNSKNKIKGVLQFFLRLTTGYGEKPLRILMLSLLMIIIFGISFSLSNNNNIYNLFDYLYQSLLIFNSFGLYDSMISDSFINRILISIEIFFGIILINGFIILLARKILR